MALENMDTSNKDYSPLFLAALTIFLNQHFFVIWKS